MSKALVEYFQRCYAADNDRSVIWNFPADAKENSDFAYARNSQDWQNDMLTGQITPEFLKRIAVSVGRETALQVGSHFVVGRRTFQAYGNTYTKYFCTPLFWYSADSLELNAQTGNFSLPIDQRQLNDDLLRYIMCCNFQNDAGGEGDGDSDDAITSTEEALTEQLSRLHASLTPAVMTRDVVHLVEQLNAAVNTRTNSVVLSLEPLPKRAGRLPKSSQKTPTHVFAVYACLGFSLLPRPTSSRGLLHELELLSNMAPPNYSASLAALMCRESDSNSVLPALISTQPVEVPGVLSDAQTRIIQQSRYQALSLLVGPPGTGKSYTIAAAALDAFAKGQSILVVSNNQHAVDVVQRQLVETFGIDSSAVVRAGAKHYHRDLIKHLKNLQQLGSQKAVEQKQQQSAFAFVQWLRQRLEIRAWRRLQQRLVKQEQQLKHTLEQAEQDGGLLQLAEQVNQANKTAQDKTRLSLWQRYRLSRIKRQQAKLAAVDYIAPTETVLPLSEQLAQTQTLRQTVDATMLQRIKQRFDRRLIELSQQHRHTYAAFQSAVKSRSARRQQQFFAQTNFQALIDGMPIWLSSLDALHKVLPLQADLFDVVIIDEATQCDIASCLPALQRGKRALVVGDPKQLKHISFLSRVQQHRIAEQCGLQPEEVMASYRDDSIIDFVQSVLNTPSITLDEHYRSHPDIIRFSNQRFYANQLRVMTARPQYSAGDNQSITPEPALQVISVANGKRIKKVNRVEADAVLAKLAEIMTKQQHLPTEHKQSLGVVCWFRDQANYIQDRLINDFPLEQLLAHKLRCGTAYSFQGEERSIILISCGVDVSSPAAAYTYMSRPDVFNVGITRARHQQLIYLSVPLEQLPEKSLLNRYLQSMQAELPNDSSLGQPITHVVSRMSSIQEVCLALQSMGLQTVQHYPIAGYAMDVIVLDQQAVLAIDLVGFSGEAGLAMHSQQYERFERTGLEIMPVSLASWRYNRQGVLKVIRQRLDKLQKAAHLLQQQQTHFAQHWLKLQASHPELAEEVRVVENNIVPLGWMTTLQHMGELVDQFVRVYWVLNEVLNPQEITFVRYSQAAEKLLVSCLGELAKCHRQTQATGQQVTSNLHVQHDAMQSAIQAMQNMAQQWSAAERVNGQAGEYAEHDFDMALADMQRLNKNVSGYLKQ